MGRRIVGAVAPARRPRRRRRWTASSRRRAASTSGCALSTATPHAAARSSSRSLGASPNASTSAGSRPSSRAAVATPAALCTPGADSSTIRIPENVTCERSPATSRTASASSGSDSSGCRTISFVTVSPTSSSTGATRSEACGYIATQSGSRANRAPSCPAKITPGSASRTDAAISAATPCRERDVVEHLAGVEVEQHRAVHAHAERVDAEVEVEPLHPPRRPPGRGQHRRARRRRRPPAPPACGRRSCRRRAAACRPDRTRRAPAGGRSRRLRVGHRRRRRRHCGAARRPVAGAGAERLGELLRAAPARPRRSRRSACRARSRAPR